MLLWRVGRGWEGQITTSIGIRVSTVLLINYITSILFTDLGSQRVEGYTIWSKHIHTGMRNAGRRHSFLTLKMYKVFSKSYRKWTKQASLFC